jgi:hypothetical protein
MQTLGFSLILKGNSYYKKFKNYSIFSLKKTLDKLDKKKISLIFLISTEKKFEKNIEKLFNNCFYNHNFKIIFDYYLDKYPVEKINYKLISKIQMQHLIKAKEDKFDYISFLYADIIYSNNAFFYSLNLLNINRKISAVCSFALSLNYNSSFKIFYEKLINNEDYLKFFINNANNLISNFHKKFFYEKNILSNSNFIFTLKKNGILIKSKHYHPIIIRTSKIININFATLDSEITKIFKNPDEIYVEKDMKKISLFSFDSIHIPRNRIIKNNNLRKVNKLFYKKISLINLQSNIAGNNFFLKNYIGFTFTKYIKIESLNNFFNYFIKNSNHKLKKNIEENFKNLLLELNLIIRYKILKFLIKNILFYKIICKNKILLNLLHTIFKIGLINNSNINNNKNLEILNIFYIIFSVLSFTKKVVALFLFFTYKRKL